MKKALCNVNLIDGSDSPPIANATIIINGERIEYAGPTAGVQLDPKIQAIDLSGKWALPGLIDLHCHCTYSYHFYSETARIGDSPYSDSLIALAAVPRLEEALQAGETCLRDTGARGNTIYDLRQAIKTGYIRGPRLCVSGQIIIPTGGHAYDDPRLVFEADGEANVRVAVRHQIKSGADFIKIAINSTEWTQAEMNAAVDEAHRWNRKIACHVTSAVSTRMAIEAGVDSLEHARFFRENDFEKIAERGIVWVAAVSGVLDKIPLGEQYLNKPGLPEDFRKEIIETLEGSRKVVDVQRTNIEMALAAGVTIGAGTDRSGLYGPDPFTDLVRELEVLHELGLSNHQALLTATSVAAETMEWQDRVGNINDGHFADILVVAENPLSDLGALRNVVMVLKGGEMMVDRTEGSK